MLQLLRETLLSSELADYLWQGLCAVAQAVPGGAQVGKRVLRLVSPRRRAVHRLRRRPDLTVFQPFPTTAEDRYPELFDALGARLASLPVPRILSFGCASGEEVRALPRRIPQARITGMDVNPHALGLARRADRGGRYLLADAPDPRERFDAVLALTVFRHDDLEAGRPPDCAAILSFASVEAGVARLDAVLEPGGWLAIWNAHFRFADMAVAARYAPDPLRIEEPLDLLYGPDDRRIENASYDEVLFQKRTE